MAAYRTPSFVRKGALKYVKNVGRSFGYSVVDAVKEYNPQIVTLIKGSKELTENLYETIDSYKAKIKGTEDEKGLIGIGKDAVKEFRDNLFDDLKTGNWYNKQRIEANEDALVNEMFGFSEDDFDLDNLDLDFDDNDDLDVDMSDEPSDADAIIASQRESTNAVIGAMDAVGGKIAGATSNAIVRSADYQVAAQRQSSRAIFSLTEKGFHSVNTGIAAINANISQLVSLGEPLSIHLSNSATFYTHSSEYQKSVLEKLDKIIESTTIKKDDRYTRKTTLDSLLDNDVLDLSGYFDYIHENIKSTIDEVKGLVDMFGGVESLTKMVTGAPLKMLTTTITKKMIPDMIKNAMQSFNDTLGAFFAGFMDKAQHGKLFKGSIGELIDLMSDTLFPRERYITKPDTSDYNKERTFWNGKSEKALQEVIPTYLSVIASALTGAPETRFNYSNGKYETIHSIRRVEAEREKGYAESAGGDFRNDALSMVSMMGLNKETKEKMQKEINDFFLQAFRKGKASITEINDKNFNYKDLGLSEDSLAILRDLLKAYVRTGKTSKALRAASEMRLQRDRFGEDTRNLTKYNDPALHLYNGSTIISGGIAKDKAKDTKDLLKPGGILGVDKYNNDIFFYLQGIWQHTKYVAEQGIGTSNGNYTNIGRNGTTSAGYRANNRGIYVPNSNGSIFSNIPLGVIESIEEQISNANSIGGFFGSSDGNITDTLSLDAFIEQKYAGEYEGRSKKKKDTAEYKNKLRQIQREYDIGNITKDEYDMQIAILNSEDNTKLVDKLREKLKRFVPSRSDEQNKSSSSIFSKLLDMMRKPAEIVSDILGAGEVSLYRLIYGKDEDDERNGLFGYFFSKADIMFDKFQNFLQTKWWDNAKKWLKDNFGKGEDGEEGFLGATKRELKNAATHELNSVKRLLGLGSTEPADVTQAANNAINNNGTAATGRKVTKTGIVSVSEGEMIVPSEFNPYYHGTNDKKLQLSRERAASNKFFGHMARGGFVGTKNQEYDYSTREWVYYDENGNELGRLKATAKEIERQRRKRAIDFATNIDFDNVIHRRDVAYNKDGSFNEARTSRNDNISKAREQGGVKNIAKGSISLLINGIQDFAERLLPKNNDKEASIIDKYINQETQDKIKEADIPKEARKNKGAVGAGAVIGLGASLLTGAIVGPLAGAAIGAGVGLTVRSEKVQKLLFGDEDDNGDKKGGLLPKKVANFVAKKLPNIGRATGYGAVAGTLFGSPVIGAILGGAIGFASQSESFKDKLFGKLVDGKRQGGFISKEIQEKVKKAAPNIGAGALASVIIGGPFGLIGSIMLGGALGYASTTDKFKEFILGKENNEGKREGGLVGRIRTYFFGEKDKDGKGKQGLFVSLNNIFHNLGNDLRIGARNMFDSAGRFLRKLARRKAKSTLGQKIANSRVGRAVIGAGKAAFNVVKSPLTFTRWGAQKIDDKISMSDLRGGNNIYNAKEGRMMTAAERLKQRELYGMEDGVRGLRNVNSRDYANFKNFDEYLSTFNSEEDLNRLKETLTVLKDPTKQYDKELRESKNKFAKDLEDMGIDPKLALKLEKKAAKGGNLNYILDDAKYGLTKEQKKAISESASGIYGAEDKIQKALADRESYRRQLLNGGTEGILGDLKGLDISSDNDVARLLDLVDAESKARFNMTEEEKEKQKEVQRDETKVEQLRNINDILIRIYNHATGNNLPLTSGTTDNNGNPDNQVPVDEETAEENEKAMKKGSFFQSNDFRDANRSFDVQPEQWNPNIFRRMGKGLGKAFKAPGNIMRGAIRTVGRTADYSAGQIVEGLDNLIEIAPGVFMNTVTGAVTIAAGAFQGVKSAAKSFKRYIDYNWLGKDYERDNQDAGLADERDDIVTQTDSFGNIYQMRRNEQGELVMDETDSQTQQAMRSQNKLKEALYHIPVLGGLFAKASGFLGSIKEGLFGKEKDGKGKDGIFTKFFNKSKDMLMGENGFLSSLLAWFTGTSLGGAVKGIFTKFTKFPLKSVLAKAIPIGLLYAAHKGVFNDLFRDITGGGYGKGKKADEKTATVKDANGNDTKVTYIDNGDGTGTWTDENGNTYTDDEVNDINVRNTSNKSFGEKLNESAVRGVITGKGSVTTSLITKALRKTKIGNKLLDSAGKAVSTFKDLGSDSKVTRTLAKRGMSETIVNGCMKFTNLLRKVPCLRGIADKVDELGLALANKLSRKLAEGGARKALEFAKTAVAWARVAFVVIDFTTGYEDARSTLGIIDEPTFGQRIVCGIFRAAKNFIPIIGVLIPDSEVIDLICNFIGPALHIAPKDLLAKRQKAQETVEAYNEEHGTDYTVTEYNKSVLKDYTWTERLGNSFKSTWEDTKNKFNKAKEGIKEKGFSGYMKETVTNMTNDFMKSYEDNGGGISGMFSAIGDTFKSILPGTYGDIAEAKNDIAALAFKGKLGEMWKVTLPDFRGGEAVEGQEGVTTAMPSLFSRIIGQVPLFLSKIINTPIAIIASLFSKIKGLFSDKEDSKENGGFFSSLKKGFENITGHDAIKSLAKKGKFKEMWEYNNVTDKDNGFMKVIKALPATFNKISYTPLALISKLGNFIKEGISNAFKNTLDNVKLVGDKINEMKELAEEGDYKGVGAVEANITEENNPLHGFFNAIFKVGKAMYTLRALLDDVFDGIGELFGKKEEKDKETIDKTKEGLDNARSSKVVDIMNEATTRITGAMGGRKATNEVQSLASKSAESISNAVGENKTSTTQSLRSNSVDRFSRGINAQESATGSGLRSRKFSGGGSKDIFVSQKDDRYANIDYADSNIGEKGCAPATASMLINYVKPGSVTMDQAIRDARLYQNENGTSADYFKNILNKHGLESNYIDATSKNGREQVINSLANGQPAVLLGQDATNTDKKYSPFGPDKHFVMATGFDKYGNVIINDPESNTPDKVYNPNILDKINLAVSTNQTDIDENTDALLKLAGGAGFQVPDNEIARNVWAYFTSKGYSDAATAGIMGNAYAESGINPAIVQKGSGHAAGLFQWESYKNKEGRWKAMADYAASKGRDWTDLQSQLEYGESEIPGLGYYFKNRTGRNSPKPDIDGKTYFIPKATYETFKEEKDPKVAAVQFEAAFERAGKPGFAKRMNAAEQYYNLYSGSDYTGNFNPEVGSVSGGPLYADAQSAVDALKKGNSSLAAPLGPNSSGLYTDSQSAVDALKAQSRQHGGSEGSFGDESASKPKGLKDILTTITSAFSNAFDNILIGGKESGETAVDENGNPINSNYSSEEIASMYGDATRAVIDSWGTNNPNASSEDRLKATTKTGLGTAQNFVNIARSQLGVEEEPTNITPYGKFTGTDGYPWCAAFVEWCMDKTFNGIKEDREKVMRGKKTASVSTLYDNFKAANAMTMDPQPGDVVIYRNNNASHTGLVEFVDGNIVHTIEGNTSADNSYNRNGGVVARKQFDKTKNNRLTGFGRPDWDAVSKRYNKSAQMGKEQISAMGSGIDMDKLEKSYKVGQSINKPNNKIITPPRFTSGGASGIPKNPNNELQLKPTDTVIVTLLKTLVKTVQAISNNTTSVPELGTTITNYCKAKLTTDVQSEAQQVSNITNITQNGNMDKVDPSRDPELQDLMNTLSSIAAG